MVGPTEDRKVGTTDLQERVEGAAHCLAHAHAARPTNFPEATDHRARRIRRRSRLFQVETYSKRKYAEIGVSDDWLQDGVSLSAKNVVRGMHYQPGMAKLVNALAGGSTM